MSFDWKEYLEVAKGIAEDTTLLGDQEAKQRCAMSRAYYAVYNFAKQYVLSIDPQANLSGGSVHFKLISYYRDHERIELNEIGDDIDFLRLNRIQADYKIVFDGDLSDAVTRSLVTAQEIIDKLESY